MTRCIPGIAAAALLAALLALPAQAEAPAGSRVELTAPVAGTPIVGQVAVSFRLVGVADADVAKAVVLLDRRPAAQLKAPPWSASIEAGDDLARHELTIEVTLTAGGVLRVRRTFDPGAGSAQIDVRLINLAATVETSGGKRVRNVELADFDLLVDGRPVPIERFTRPPAQIAVALVLDTSLSMQGDRIVAARAAASAFLDKLAPGDVAAVVPFSDEVRIGAPLGIDRDAQRAAVGTLNAAGGTALYDAVERASRLLRDAPPGARRVLLVLSDGRDEAASGLEPGSFHTLDEAVRAVHDSDAILFTVGLGSQLERETDFAGTLTAFQVLDRLSTGSGGRVLRVPRFGNLGTAFGEIQEELRQQYDSAFRPPGHEGGTTFHRIELKLKRPGVVVRTRDGYYG